MNERICDYKNNNELDIEKIINEYSNYLLVVIKNICINSLSDEDVEEILLDTFLALWKNKEKLDEEKSIKPYISSIAHNLTKKKLTELNKTKPSKLFEETTVIDTMNLDFMVDNYLQNQELNSIINELSDEDYQIFTLFYYYSNKVKEISNKLNISTVKVKTKLHRIRNTIKKKLKKGGYGV